MALGLQVWDLYGDLVVDTNSKLMRFLGVVTVGGSGSMTVPEFSQGTAWVKGYRPELPGDSGLFWNTSTSIHWTDVPAGTKLLYGVL